MILKCAHCSLRVCASDEADYPDFCPMPAAALNTSSSYYERLLNGERSDSKG